MAQPDSIFMIIFENNSKDIVRAKPYFDALSRTGVFLNNYFGTSRPSQTDYLALTGGSTFGVTTDVAVSLPNRNLFDLLDMRGISWKIYAENYPGGNGQCDLSLVNNCVRETNFLDECNPCPVLPEGRSKAWYVRYHVPALLYSNITDDPNRCAKVVNARELQRDTIESTLPQFAIYIPNLYNDGHNTNASYSNDYMMTTFSPLFRDEEFTNNRIIIILYDEDGLADTPPDQTRCNSKQEIPVYCVFLGPNVRANEILTQTYTHYNMLRFIENHFHLGTLGNCDAVSEPINGILRKSVRSKSKERKRLCRFLETMVCATIEATYRPMGIIPRNPEAGTLVGDNPEPAVDDIQTKGPCGCR